MAAAKPRRRRAVFLDRDGVVIRTDVRDGKPYAVRSLKRMRLLPGVRDAVATLRQAGFVMIIVTNQPDIGNGLVSAKTVQAMHARLHERLEIDDIKLCPHSQRDACLCRKPLPGMLLEAARDWNLDLKKSCMVGDRWGDIIAGKAAGCYTVFIERGYTETPRENRNLTPDYYATSLPAATHRILSTL